MTAGMSEEAITAPHLLSWERDTFWWPLKWGEHPLCGDDPCDELPAITWVYALQQGRDERRPKPYYTQIRWTP